MKITRNEIKQMLLEMNPDGTISQDEDSRQEVLQKTAITDLEKLLTFVNEQALEIGGPFRAPGIRKRILREFLTTIRGFLVGDRR